MIASRAYLLVALSASITTSALAGDADADKKLIKRILPDIELAPSLYAKDEAPATYKTLPKFPAKRLAEYGVDKKETADKERERWKAHKEQYAKDLPLRAAIFEAADESDKLKRLEIPMVIPMTVFTPKDKAAFLLKQEPLGITIFKLQILHKQMQEAAEKKDQEKSKRWKANFDLALTRMQGNLIFLYEYNYSLGQIRADTLPELGKEHDGWTIAFLPKISVTQAEAKTYAKNRAKLLQKIQEEHAGTPWAYFAERESKRDLGMMWAAKKK
jgi:hypothetical protein